jgi:transposase-like protein
MPHKHPISSSSASSTKAEFAVESLNASLQRVPKQRKAFPNSEAILKVLYPALHQVARKLTMLVQNWKQALNQSLPLLFGERLGI